MHRCAAHTITREVSAASIPAEARIDVYRNADEAPQQKARLSTAHTCDRRAPLTCVAEIETEGVLVSEPLAETLGVPVTVPVGETVKLDVAVAVCSREVQQRASVAPQTQYRRDAARVTYSGPCGRTKLPVELTLLDAVMDEDAVMDGLEVCRQRHGGGEGKRGRNRPNSWTCLNRQSPPCARATQPSSSLRRE